jgi:hypothetical protein
MRISQLSWVAILAGGGIAGIFGTFCMDMGGAMLRRWGLIAGPPPAQVAKWFAYLPQGMTFHADIASVPALPISFRTLMTIHYGIGLILGVSYLGIRAWLSLAERNPASQAAVQHILVRPLPLGSELLLALAYGIATSVFAWFLMFPGMGYGIFGLNAPSELKLFRTSLINHALYGLGVGLCWFSLGSIFFFRAR